LIIKVENDEPLKGRCQVCPEVDYASEQKEAPTLNLDIFHQDSANKGDGFRTDT